MLECCCNNVELEWKETFDVEGGILEGYIIEHQIWECPECGQAYEVQLRVNVDPQNAEVDQVLAVE